MNLFACYRDGDNITFENMRSVDLVVTLSIDEAPFGTPIRDLL